MLESACATPTLIVMQANGNLVSPSISDGVRSITYHGLVPSGLTMEFDGVTRQVRLDGNDVTPYVIGEFPVLLPGANTLTYNDATTSTHLATAAIWFYARWW